MRIMRQPDVLNEAYAFRYPLRPWPLAHVPATTAVSVMCSPLHMQAVHCALCSLLHLWLLALLTATSLGAGVVTSCFPIHQRLS